MKLYDLAAFVIMGAILFGLHMYSKETNPEYAAKVQEFKDKARTYHQTKIEPHRDTDAEPAWSKEAFEAK